MNEFINKLIERLENASHWEASTFDEDGYSNDDSEEVIYLDKAISIINQWAEEYNNGWIPVSERLPDKEGKYLVTLSRWNVVTFANFKNAMGYKHFDNGHVAAWMPCPAPFKEII